MLFSNYPLSDTTQAHLLADGWTLVYASPEHEQILVTCAITGMRYHSMSAEDVMITAQEIARDYPKALVAVQDQLLPASAKLYADLYLPDDKTLTRKVYALLRQIESEHLKESFVRLASYGRTTSIRALAPAHRIMLLELITEEVNTQLQPMRSSLVHHLCTLGMVDRANNPDYPRINRWCRQYTAAKKPLLWMNKSQLQATLTQVKVWVKKEVSS